ncbi:DUF5979 domain-containing protein [Dietzia sp. NPDC055340]
MRDRFLLHRGGEGVVRWFSIPVMLAVLVLIATSLTFPWAASAEEPTTAAPTATSTATPTASNKATTTTSTASTSARTGVSSTQAPARPSTFAPAAVADANNARQAPQAADEGIETYALNPGIKVEITEILVEDGSSDEQIEVGDSVEVHGTWDARSANPKPGDEFTIRFPDELKLTDTIDFSLVGAEGEIWGTCEVSVPENVMTCALSDAVTERPEEVHGSFYVYSKAVKYTTADEVTFTINNTLTAGGRLPGGGGISDGNDLGSAVKSGKLQPDKAAVRWTIDIPGSDLIALDAEGNGTATLSDDLSDTMQLCEAPRLNPVLQSGRPGSLQPVPGGVTVTQSGGAGTPIAIEIANDGAFQADQLYRIEYTTCTVSGEPDLSEPDGEPVIYNNSVTIGDTTVSAPGVEQGWRPETLPWKEGWINTGDRNRSVNWTITVPGSFIAASDGHAVTIDEDFIGEHAVCEDGLKVAIARSDYLPGPSGSGPTHVDVTDQFTLSNTADPGDTQFTIDFSPKDISAFDPEQYYYVKFASCVTTEQDVPDSGDLLRNEATVNGEDVAWELRPPGFTSSKSGQVNLEPTTVAGEQQPVGSTIDWQVRIPGHHLENVTKPAVINDTFSDTMAVCEVGDDLKENLNLSVIARDFKSDGDINPERDLTEAADVELIDGGVSFTLPRDEGDYSREINYFIDYTLCTSSGGLDQRGTVYENTLAYNGKDLTSSTRQSSGGGGTGQGVSRGSFSLEKSIHAFSEEFDDKNTVFTVLVEEFAPGVDPATGTAESTYEVEVKADGTAVSGLNPRGTGWQIRLSEIKLPSGNGVYFEPGVFKPGPGITLHADGTQAIVAVQPKTNVGVELENRAHHGTATVTKTVTGDAKSELTGNERFVIQADIDTGVAGEGTELRQFTLRDGQHYNLGDLPIGTTVTFSEVQPANTDRITWAKPVIVPETLVIGKDPAANAVSVTNEASITEGTFMLSKDMRGPEAFNPAVPEFVDVVATWANADGIEQSKTLQLPTNGTSIEFGEKLPGGTEVILTETVPEDGSGIAWGSPSYSGSVTIGDDGQAVVTIGKDTGAVTVTNYVDTNDGTLRLTKQISGEAAEAASDAEFTVEARWKDGTDYRTERLTVTPGESTPLGVDLPVGTEVTFTEVGLPEIAGVEWGDISWGTDPSGESWLINNPGGTATGIVSDDPTDGRLITLTNEATWQFGSVGFEKFIFDGDTPVPATEADLPDGAEFEVQIDGIDPALPAGTDFPAVGDRITLNAANDWSWNSGDVLPRGTVVTFSEVDPEPLDGLDWARPFYYVTADAGEPGDRNTVEIVPGERAEVEIRNRPIPTTEVEIDKIVTGPKGGQVTDHESTTFQVTATWTDVDDEDRSCILDVTPNGGMTPTAECDATIIDGRVQFPRDTEIAFIETGAHTDVGNVNWGDVTWSVTGGNAETGEIDGEPTGVVVTLTGDDPVTLELENETSSNGLIIIPIPIPLPPFDGGSSNGSSPDPGGSSGTSTGDPSKPGQTSPQRPDRPVDPQRPIVAGESGHNGAPGKPAPARPDKAGKSSESALAVTGANVAWLGGAALVLIAGGALLMLRNRRDQAAE